MLACLVLTGTARAQSNIKGWGSTVFDSSWNSETAFVEVAAGGWPHGGAAERRLRRRVGVTTSTASATCRRFRPGSPTSRSRRASGSHGGAAERRLRRRVGGQRLRASATFRRFRPGSPTSRSRRATVTRWRGGATAPSSRGGRTSYGQCNVPALPGGLTYVEVAAGDGHTVARRSDGSVVAWGGNSYGPVQRSGASGRAHLRRGRGGR